MEWKERIKELKRRELRKKCDRRRNILIKDLKKRKRKVEEECGEGIKSF